MENSNIAPQEPLLPFTVFGLADIVIRPTVHLISNKHLVQGCTETQAQSGLTRSCCSPSLRLDPAQQVPLWMRRVYKHQLVPWKTGILQTVPLRFKYKIFSFYVRKQQQQAACHCTVVFTTRINILGV